MCIVYFYHNKEFDRASRYKDRASELCLATCKYHKNVFASSWGKVTLGGQCLYMKKSWIFSQNSNVMVYGITCI